MESVSRIPLRILLERGGAARGELIRFLAPRTVDAILRILPLEGRAALWQDEVYFEIPVKMGAEKATRRVETGTVAYWPMGRAFCVFFGKSQPYSPVNRIGKIETNLELFKKVKRGAKIRVERAYTTP